MPCSVPCHGPGSKPHVRIEDWFWLNSDRAQLVGKVFGHPRIQDGHRVITSLVKNISDGIVETQNTVYVLGQENTDAEG